MRHVLRQGELGPDDDFFEHGGDSLLAITLMLRVSRELGMEFPTRSVDEAFTARRLAAILDSPSVLRSKYPAGVVEIRKGTAERPLFCLPGLGATALQFRTLAAKMHTQRPILGIEIHDLQLEPAVLESIEGTAEAVVRNMRQVQPIGPYAILGYSFGGNLAIEGARQLIAKDQMVEFVAILDAYAPGSLRNPSGLRKVATHLRIIARLQLKESYEYISSRIQKRLFPGSQNSLSTDPEPLLLGSELERRIAEVSKHCIRAFHAHRARVYPGRIVLIRADDLNDWVEVADPSGTCGWGSICKGGVEVVPMTCRHLDMFKEPHLTKLARHVNDLLSAILI